MSNTIDSLDLTDRQNATYAFLCDYYFREGMNPTQEQMSLALGMTGRTSIRTHLRALMRKGWVKARFVKSGTHTRIVYIPAIPFARVAGTGRDVILLGTVGGAVTFTLEAWIAWLRKHLTAVEEFLDAHADNEEPLTLGAIRQEDDIPDQLSA